MNQPTATECLYDVLKRDGGWLPVDVLMVRHGLSRDDLVLAVEALDAAGKLEHRLGATCWECRLAAVPATEVAP